MTKTPREIVDLKELWRNVCAARGTRLPQTKGLDEYLIGMPDSAKQRLSDTLSRCRKGTELARDFGVISWASACTHEAIPAKAQAVNIDCTASELFVAGLTLMDDGIDPAAFVMGMETHIKHADMLRKLLPVPQFAESPPANTTPLRDATPPLVDSAKSKPRVTGGFTDEEVGIDIFEASAPKPRTVKPRVIGQDPQAGMQTQDGEPGAEPGWVSVRIFGKTAAHTLEISNHRRSRQFLGVNVVSIESARPLANGGYDWNNKLSLQLTPEEMPEVIAVLLGLVGEVTFSNHGSDRNKSVTFKNQEGGMLVSTSTRSDAYYPVPVKRSVVYFLLDLFCRAMAAGTPDRKPSDVISLVRGIYG